MKIYFKIFLIFLIASFLQQILPSISFLGGLKIPFFSSVMLYCCFRLDDKNAWICTIIAGFIFDGLEPGPYGPALISYSIITLLVLRFRNNLFHNGIITQIFCGGISGIIIINISILTYFLTDSRPLNYLLLKIIGSLFLGAFTFPICSKILSEFIPSQERGGQI